MTRTKWRDITQKSTITILDYIYVDKNSYIIKCANINAMGNYILALKFQISFVMAKLCLNLSS
jgi:hypothetical protein